MNIKFLRNIVLSLCLIVMGVVATNAKTVTYRIVEYNATAQSFTLAPAGERPLDSFVWLENTFGATSGNRYNQIPRNREATLSLYGWGGCTINSVTLSMCSNNASGTFALLVNLGSNQVFKTPVAPFDSEQWFGRWVSKDLHVYVDIAQSFPSPITVGADDDLHITVKGGTQEGSVYLNSITIDYDTDGATESALPWIFSRIPSKATIADGEVVMIYRNGDAAGDIDGMEVSHYLDAIAVASTTTVDDPDVLLFTLNKTSDNHWTITNQWGQKLGARGEKNLAWDEGVTTWDISSGYDGATIASTNAKYGTLRYNTPSGSYARFWNYTSKTLQLPFLYRRDSRQQPVVSTALTLSETQRTVTIAQDTVVITHKFAPSGVTDQRVVWTSSNNNVARVRSGIVEILAPGTATITATAVDGGSQATCIINVTSEGGAIAGDINGDGQVDINDMNVLINLMLGTGNASIPAVEADLNGDGQVDIQDVNMLINIILGL